MYSFIKPTFTPVYMDEHPDECILFFKGVHMSDTQVVKNEESRKRRPPVKHTKIPCMFTSIKSWPALTDLRCWACDCSFLWEPMFIAESIGFSGMNRGQYTPIKPVGNFCSFPCAVVFIEKGYPKNRQWEMKELLKLLHLVLTGVKIADLPPSREVPKKTDREEYGGEMSKSTFQSVINRLSMDFHICFPAKMRELTKLKEPTGTRQERFDHTGPEHSYFL